MFKPIKYLTVAACVLAILASHYPGVNSEDTAERNSFVRNNILQIKESVRNILEDFSNWNLTNYKGPNICLVIGKLMKENCTGRLQDVIKYLRTVDTKAHGEGSERIKNVAKLLSQIEYPCNSIGTQQMNLTDCKLYKNNQTRKLTYQVLQNLNKSLEEALKRLATEPALTTEVSNRNISTREIRQRKEGKKNKQKKQKKKKTKNSNERKTQTKEKKQNTKQDNKKCLRKKNCHK